MNLRGNLSGLKYGSCHCRLVFEVCLWLHACLRSGLLSFEARMRMYTFKKNKQKMVIFYRGFWVICINIQQLQNYCSCWLLISTHLPVQGSIADLTQAGTLLVFGSPLLPSCLWEDCCEFQWFHTSTCTNSPPVSQKISARGGGGLVSGNFRVCCQK